MEWLSSSSFDPFYLENNEILFQTPYEFHNPTQLPPLEDDQIIPIKTTLKVCPASQNVNDHKNSLLAQVPHFSERDYDLLKGNDHDNDGGDGDDTRPHEKNEKKKKQKINHKEIERQRRLEMSSLHGSLRSLLPIDFIKGKRSMSDHLDSTVKYIRHLQERIEAKSEERDAVKAEVEVGNSNYEVIINSLNDGGVEVIVSTSTSTSSSSSSSSSNEGDGSNNGQGMPLSNVLQCLANQGLDVVSCTTNKLTNKFIHTILAQVEDGKNNQIDPLKLQQKLLDMYP